MTNAPEPAEMTELTLWEEKPVEIEMLASSEAGLTYTLNSAPSDGWYFVPWHRVRQIHGYVPPSRG